MGDVLPTYGTTDSSSGVNDGAHQEHFKQSFSIAEPYTSLHDDTTPLNRGGSTGLSAGVAGLLCCPRNKDSGNDGFKAVVLFMAVFAAGVTVALVVQVASGVSSEPLDVDHTVSDEPLCGEIGDRIMSEGGNAVDAAVAATFCLAVTSPHLTGLGGGGTMLLHKNRENKTVIIDFREAAPAGVEARDIKARGLSSIGIPGLVRGLAHAHSNYGSGHKGLTCCSWSHLIQPALNLSKKIMASQSLVNASVTKISEEELKQSSNLSAFLRPGGVPFTTSTHLRDLPMYVEMLNSLASVEIQGAEEFYTGALADQLVAELQGAITLDDLANYAVIEREAIQTEVAGFRVLASPAPTSGPQLLAFLNAMDEYMERFGGVPAVDEAYLANVTQVLERTEWFQLGLGDPVGNAKETVDERTKWMINKRNAPRFLNKDVDSTTDSFKSMYPFSPPAAASVIAMDREDNYVSVVSSLNTWFGSGVLSTSAGIMNNALANFAPASSEQEEQKSLNLVQEGRRPHSGVAPALAIDANRVCGQRILVGGATADSVGQVLTDAVIFKQDLQVSIDRSRLQVLQGRVLLEEAYEGFGPSVQEHFGLSAQASAAKLPYNAVSGMDKTADRVLPCQDQRGDGGDSTFERRSAQSVKL